MDNVSKREYESPKVTLIRIESEDILSLSPGTGNIGFIGDIDDLDVNSGDTAKLF